MLEQIHRFSIPLLKKFNFHLVQKTTVGHTLGIWTRSLNKKKNKNPSRLVIIPGFADSSLPWLGFMLPLLPFLKNKYDEICILDFPGFHGHLKQEKPFRSMDKMLESMESVLAALAPTTLIGHSLGGWLAAHFAVHCAENKIQGPTKLVLLSPGGVVKSDKELQKWAAIYDAAKTGGFESYRPKLFHKEPLFFNFIAHELSDFFLQKEILDFMDSIRLDHFLTEKIASINCPIALIWGKEDRICPSKWSRDWAQATKKSRHGKAHIILISKAGHVPQVERPFLVAKHLVNVLLS